MISTDPSKAGTAIPHRLSHDAVGGKGRFNPWCLLRASLSRGTFANQAAVLAGGTALAQLISVLAAPIQARLYGAASYGVLASFSAAATILGLLATGRYELAIPMSSTASEAMSLLYLCSLFSGGTAALVITGVILVQISGVYNSWQIPWGSWVWLLPLVVLWNAGFNALQLWFNRLDRYKTMAQARIIQAGVGAAVTILLGLCSITSGLIYGTVVAQLIALAWLVRQLFRTAEPGSLCPDWGNIQGVMKRYGTLPMHLAPAQLLGTIALQLPTLFFAKFYGLRETGYFAMGMRVITLPTGIVAAAIGEVYRQRAARAYATLGNCRQLFLNTLQATSAMALLPFGILLLGAPWLFTVVFGPGWAHAGDYARLLAISGFFQFVLTPVDKNAVLVGATRYILLWHTGRLLGLLLIAGATLLYRYPPLTFISLLVVHHVLLYGIDGIVGYRLSMKGLLS